MKHGLRTFWWWLIGLGLAFAGCGWLALSEVRRLHNDFDVDARITHRLLSQKVVQYDAVLATLALLGDTDGHSSERPEQGIATVYPSILHVDRQTASHPWSASDTQPIQALNAAVDESRKAGHAVVANADFAHGRYQLVMAADKINYALTLDLSQTVPWSDWPMNPETSPIRVVLESAGQRYVIQAGDSPLKNQQTPESTAGQMPLKADADSSGFWHFHASKVLASQSQAFDVIASRSVALSALPWWQMLLWTLFSAVLVGGISMFQGQRAARKRAEELLRLGQVSRLNALGELAAGMAHELNQPLTAVLASTQAAQRLLKESEPDLDTARLALLQAVAQSQRAAEVVARLRRAVERPGSGVRPIALQEAVNRTLYLLEPETHKRQVNIQMSPSSAQAPSVQVQADPVALEQIIHNLLMNALQSLDGRQGERRIDIDIRATDQRGFLRISDNGPGIPAELQARLFEPFFSTRSQGLGLGLSLCETLASEMNGTLRLSPSPLPGASFELELPLSHS